MPEREPNELVDLGLADVRLLDEAREVWANGLQRTKAEVADLIIRFREQNPGVSYRAVAERCAITNEATGEPYGRNWYSELVQWRTSAREDKRPFARPTAEAKGRGAVEVSRVLREADPEQAAELVAAAMQSRPEVALAVDRRRQAAIRERVAASPAPTMTREEVDAAAAERHGRVEVPLDPWGPFHKAIALLDQTHERMHADAWNLPPTSVAYIADKASAASTFLAGLAEAALEHTNN